MTSRTARILLIAWLVWCLNVFLPGHTRGVMTVATPADQPSCCTAGSSKHHRDQKPTPEQRACCAVCYFAAGLSTPLPTIDALAALGLAEILPPAPLLPAPTREASLPYFPCGPPARA
jgi:hypothetical protein